MENVTARIAASITAATYDRITEEVALEKKKNILDTLGIMIAGSHAKGCPEVVDLIKQWGGREEASILGHRHKTSLYNATIANGMIARALDFDDVYREKTTHVNATIVPAALTVAEHLGNVSGRDFITAITLGADLECRMGLASKIFSGLSGMSFTYQFATFGAAAVAGKLMNLDKERMQHALGIAYSQMAGNNQCIVDGALTVRLQQGLSSGSGVLSALLAGRGITGAKEPLLGKFGYYNVYQGGQCKAEALDSGLGERFEGIYHAIKPYPCCMHSHATIDAVLKILNEVELRPEHVEEVTVGVNEAAYNMICFPLEEKQNPKTIVDAQFSLPFIVGSALVHKTIFLSSFTEQELKSERVLELARNKVHPRIDEGITARYGSGGISQADLRIRLKNGTVHHAFIEFPKGSEQNPMTVEDCVHKFERCCDSAARPIRAEGRRSLIDMVLNIEKTASMDELIRLVM